MAGFKDEIIGSPLTVWLAPTGTAFPAINAAPAVAWVQLGKRGNRNYDEEGVSVQHTQDVEVWHSAGQAAPEKAFRNEEGLVVSLTIMDLRPVMYAQALQMVYSQVVGPPAYDQVDFLRGVTVTHMALLARGPSALDSSKNAQLQVPACFQSGEPEVQWAKGQPAGLELEFTAMMDEAGTNFGQLLHAS